MKSLEQEAEEYAKTLVGIDVHAKKDFIAGANSKWVQAEKIKAQIEVLLDVAKSEHSFFIAYNLKIHKLEQQLKQLEDETLQ